MKTTKEMIEVMQAYIDGKEIECSIVDKNYNPCDDYKPKSIGKPFNWNDYDYRIKQKPKKRPMTFDEIVAYWKEHRTEIFTLNRDRVIIKGFITAAEYEESNYFTICNYNYDLQHFIDSVTKEDGSKFEVEE